MSTKRLPLPTRNADNAPFIDAWKSGKLAFQRCRGCKKPIFYPRPMCPHCWSADLEWEEAVGKGRIVSFTVVHKAGNEVLQEQVPIVVAEVRLDEGFSMIARVIVEDAKSVKSGQPLRLVSKGRSVDYSLPTFEPDPQKA